MSEIDRCSMPLMSLICDPKLSANALRQQQRGESEFVNDRERVYISKAVVVDLTLLRNKNFSLAVILFSSLCTLVGTRLWQQQLPFGRNDILGSDCPVPASTTGWQFVQRAVAGALSNSSVVRRALHSSGREAVVSYIKPEVVSYIKPAAVSCIKQVRLR
ncbi:hypothetical protein ACLKA6_001607 [Drosophila palustris]